VDRIRVLFVIAGLGRGGAEKQLHLLLKYLDRERFAPSVASLSAGGVWAERIRALDIPVTEIPRRRSLELARFRALVRLVRQSAPHIVQTMSPFDTLYGFPAACLGRAPVLIASQRTETDQYPELGWAGTPFTRILWSWADAIICNSERARRRAPSGLASRHVVIDNGIEPLRPTRSRAEVRQSLGLSETGLVVGRAGRLVSGKNYPLLLQVAREVTTTHPKTRFLVVGGGPLEAAIRAQIHELGLEGKVLLTGERDDVADLLGAVDLFLLTSDREGMPNSVMEAMTLGLPCVVTDVGATAELVVHGQTGYVCPPGDHDALAASVRGLLDNAETRYRLGANGQARVSVTYTPERMAETTMALYERTVAAKRRRAHVSPPSAAQEPAEGLHR
jgi:glycosyltransferase involved in cell wall biosynthesis